MSLISSLQPFNPLARCQKCGNFDVGTIYRPDTKDYYCKDHREEIQGLEHMHRVCGRCRYVWVERPLMEEEIAALEVAEARARAEAEATLDDDDSDLDGPETEAEAEERLLRELDLDDLVD